MWCIVISKYYPHFEIVYLFLRWNNQTAATQSQLHNYSPILNVQSISFLTYNDIIQCANSERLTEKID